MMTAELNEVKRSKRTDIHRPSAINPPEYFFVGFEYVPLDDIGACQFLQENRAIIREHMTRTGGHYSSHEYGTGNSNCMVCGSVNAIYTVLFHHEPTNTYVRMGNDCAQKCDIAFDNGDFDAFKTRIGNVRENVAGKRKAEAILSDAGFSVAWDLYNAQYSDDFKYEENTIRDIVGKLVQYGSVTEKTFTFIGKLLNDIEHRAEIEAKRKAETEAAAPVPSGRFVIEGIVLSLRLKEEGPFGPTTKMLVQHETGWKVYGTCPSSLDAQKGNRIKFTGTVTVSNNDTKFGYFSRPTKATVISSEVAVA
jgi:hypothetical protein